MKNRHLYQTSEFPSRNPRFSRNLGTYVRERRTTVSLGTVHEDKMFQTSRAYRIFRNQESSRLTRLVVTNLVEYRCHNGQLYGKSAMVAHNATS